MKIWKLCLKLLLSCFDMIVEDENCFCDNFDSTKDEIVSDFSTLHTLKTFDDMNLDDTKTELDWKEYVKTWELCFLWLLSCFSFEFCPLVNAWEFGEREQLFPFVCNSIKFITTVKELYKIIKQCYLWKMDKLNQKKRLMFVILLTKTETFWRNWCWYPCYIWNK